MHASLDPLCWSIIAIIVDLVLCVSTAELHVDLELLSILQTKRCLLPENSEVLTPQMLYFVIISQGCGLSSPGVEIFCGQ